ncbi:M1 family metallopeptidase [Taibaiella soli]|uniref:Aminopeptidase N n=1 Tax=Taibaiella soli TaxID=1649169 RepID=A0A2W2AAS9_9BACT|nr:M1 family metallopeptidase [Taibaiella soli]PZF72495.1 aminopeptidase [Taibaiella soli]
MNKNHFAALAASAVLFAACNNNPKPVQENTKNDTTVAVIKDSHSWSNADSVTLEHLYLDIKVDFDKKQIEGSANWTIDNKNKQKELRLDTYDLSIDSVLADGKKVNHTLDSTKDYMGGALHIPIEENTKNVTVYYKTGKNADALQWLKPQQTDSKKYPFLYTQSEAIHARTWVPCADGPGIRFTYDARVAVPKELLALMSAENPQQLNDSGIYHFKMDKPVPAYLMALAVGDIKFKKIDDRTGVYAEPTMIDKAAWELADMGKMVTTAEKLYGPYRWGRYDVLILPPGFPIGGMENPKLTFATPTIIAGDRSLVNLIAHELAHNWSGNLVTNATWDDIWMNEGFTVYFERRITEAMTDKSYVDMLWELGYQDLEKEIADAKDPRDTWLKLDLKGRDPDDGLSDIPYEKGSLFLELIEQNVGREKFDAFLKKYFDEHAFHSITTEQFLAYLHENLIKGDSALEKKLDINAWVYGPGIPANAPRADMERFHKVDSARTAFLNGTAPEKLENTKNWTSHEWQHFLRKMPETLTVEQMAALDKAFHFTQTGNSEIADLWFVAAVHANYTPAYPAMEQFLSKVGRQKFLEPLYGAMMHSGKEKMAKELFARYKENYHPIAQAKIGKLVNG